MNFHSMIISKLPEYFSSCFGRKSQTLENFHRTEVKSFSFKNSFKHKVFPKWNVFPKIPGSYQLDWTQLLLIVTVIAVCYCITSTLFLCQLQSAMARIPATPDPEQLKRYGSGSVGLTRLQTYHAWHLEIHHWVSIPRHRDLCSQDGQFLQLPGNLGLPSSLVHLLGSCQGGRKRKTGKFLTEACPAFKVQIVPVNPQGVGKVWPGAPPHFLPPSLLEMYEVLYHGCVQFIYSGSLLHLLW